MNALVIDDSRAMRLILGRILRGLGYTVHEASDGQIGLDQAAEIGTDLSVVLVDWNMPNMNGYEFLKAFRGQPAYASVPVMMVTSESEISQVDKAVQAGANEYIMKPFTSDAVRAKLEMIGAVP